MTLEITIQQADLLAALRTVKPAIGRAVLPIASNVLLTADGDRLRVDATNPDVRMTAWASCKVKMPGSMAVGARYLTDLVASLEPGELKLTETLGKGERFTKDHERVHHITWTLGITGAGLDATVQGMDAMDFPKAEDVTGPSITLDSAAFRRALGRVVNYAAADEERLVLTGVWCDAADGFLTMAASDGFRIAALTLPTLEPVNSFKANIPAATLGMWAKVKCPSREPAKLSINTAGTLALLSYGAVELRGTIIQGMFPGYRQLIPTKRPMATIEADAYAFGRAVNTASKAARDGAGSLRISIDKDHAVWASGKANEIGTANVNVPADVTADKVKKGEEPHAIALNSRYLADALAGFSGRVRLSLTDRFEPALFRPVEDGDDYAVVIMPMSIDWATAGAL